MFKTKTYDKEELKRILETDTSNYKPVTQAPSYSELEEQARASGEDFSDLLHREAKTLYKSIDWSANIYVMQNPAIQTAQSIHHHLPVKRMIPRLLKAIKQISEDVSEVDAFNI